MKIVFFNLSIGSSIEQSGNEILKGLKEKDVDVFNLQTRENYTFKYLMEKKPSIIIINGDNERVITPVYYYKQIYKNTKIIYISRSYDIVLDAIEGKYPQRHKIFLEDECNYISIVNLCGKTNNLLNPIKNKIIDCCGINDENRFIIETPGSKRKKPFLFLGSINPHKLSKDFLKEIQETNITIDCAGSVKNQPEWYKKIFNRCKNINYIGRFPFEDVPSVLNEYKYFVLPHDGNEPFCNSLQQAILCGNIPIVLTKYNENGIKGANGFYFGTTNLYDYIENLKELYVKDMPLGQTISNLNRTNMINKYGTGIGKNKIINIISEGEKEVNNLNI